MKPSELKTVLSEMIKSKTKITPFIWGQHGIGKSAIIRQVAKEHGYNIMNLILSQKESVDLAGIPYIFEDTHTGEKVTCNYAPNWFNEALKKGKLVLFLDEFNMARRETMAAAFELVLDRRLNNTYLPDDVVIIAAGNPDDDRYAVTPMSESLIDRFMHIQLQPEVSEWINWAQDNGIHADVVDFIRTSPQSLYTKDARDSKFPVTIKHSARSWADRASVIWSLNLAVDVKQECLAGIVGMENTTAFIKNLEANQDRPIDGKTALEDLSKVKARFDKWRAKRGDLIAATMDNVTSHIKEEKPYDKQNFLEFLLTLPEDLTIKCLLEHTGVKNNSYDFLISDKRISKIVDDYAEVKRKARES